MIPSAPLGPTSHPVLTLSLLAESGSAGRAWMGELTSCVIEPDKGGTTITSTYDGDDVEPWFIKGEAIQSTAADSLWRFVWDHSGEIVGYSMAPNGNTQPTADEPILTGTLTIGPKPDLGGAASDKTFIFGFDWQLTAEPSFDDGASS